MITDVILLDLFVLDWALPTLASLVIVYIAVEMCIRDRLYEANATANLHENIQKQHEVYRPYTLIMLI